MKHHKVATFFAALSGFFVFSLTANAQLVTYETMSSWSGSVITLNTPRPLTQTFTNVTEIESMTFRFTTTSSSSATSVEAYFAEWNPATNQMVGPELMSFGSIAIPASSTWTETYTDIFASEFDVYDHQFNLNFTTDPTKTYAMALRATSNANLGLALVDFTDAFDYGAAFRTNGPTTFAGMTATSGLEYGSSDWGFSQIVVAPYVTPVPEPRTVAAIIAALFVAVMVVRRRLQQQRAGALVPVQS